MSKSFFGWVSYLVIKFQLILSNNFNFIKFLEVFQGFLGILVYIEWGEGKL